MGYYLEANEKLSAGIKRIALEEIDATLAELRSPDMDPDEAVHEARKHFKQIRALLRLVRDEVGEMIYKRENICYRDAGRRLAPIRDRAALLETLDMLNTQFSGRVDADVFDYFREKLEAHHQKARRRFFEKEDVRNQVAAAVWAARPRVAHWPIARHDFSALSGGLMRVYRRGRKRMKKAYERPMPETFHEWRKRAKYLRYQMYILGPIWEAPIYTLEDELHDLTDYLGDHHDLAELRRFITKKFDELDGSHEAVEILIGLINQQCAALESNARTLGARIYAQKPKRFVRRIKAYWQAWQTEQREM